MKAPTAFLITRSLLLAAPLWLGACRDDPVTSYRVPKEVAPPATAPATTTANLPTDHPPVGASANAPAGAAMAGQPVATASGTGLAWTAPAHWQAKAGSAMRKGTYVITGENGATAELAITAFPGDVGGEVANVNRWRGQLLLTPIANTEAAAALTRLSTGSLQIAVLDIANPAQNPPVRMLGAMVPFAGSTWFFKLTGPDALVAKEKPAFLDFAKTIKAATP